MPFFVRKYKLFQIVKISEQESSAALAICFYTVSKCIFKYLCRPPKRGKSKSGAPIQTLPELVQILGGNRHLLNKMVTPELTDRQAEDVCMILEGRGGEGRGFQYKRLCKDVLLM